MNSEAPTAASPQQGAPPQPERAGLGSHYFRYLNANLLIMAAGMISYPIVTRLLTTRDYGIIGYFEPYALTWMAILKLGTQHSIQRFFAAYGYGEPARRRRFYTSLVLAPMLVSTVLYTLTLIGLTTVNHLWPITDVVFLYLVLTEGQIGVLVSFIDNTMRAREMSRRVAVLTVIARYLQLACVVGTIAWLVRSALGVYLARILTALVMLVVMARWILRNGEFARRDFSLPLLKESWNFGMPLIISEISLILLAFADRIMLKQFIKVDAFTQIGVYTIGYGLAMYIGVFMRSSLLPAFQPVANRIYETEGLPPVLAMQRRLLCVLYYATAALTVGLIFVGPDLLVICAGDKNAPSARVFQWVGINYLFFPIFIVASHGLVLVKRTRVISFVVASATAVNILLNLWMIPYWGIMGAVYATLISYLFMGAGQLLACPRDYRPTPRPGDLLRPLALGGLMAAAAWATNMLGATAHWARLLTMTAIFAVTFAAPALAIDAVLREQMTAMLARFRKAGRGRRS
ncbi:MAG: polysaccharide biosynthesis C-terminal domain-containing protein [bacterium]|nr:polysaccharide biosynthesis C-terminal domain-containing protein [bacterium]